jgi:hypothetical protein
MKKLNNAGRLECSRLCAHLMERLQLGDGEACSARFLMTSGRR